ncbi:MAG: DNA-binding Lrp family transcriptional regulator [Candidatus Woesearchaeota archaeon]|jgi:DNA-binding Lrp family transcriptional regulator
MNKNTSKVLYELGLDSRITTKQLAKKIRISQQAASYSISHLQDQGILTSFQTIIDPARFGFVSVMVFYNYMQLEKTKQIKDHLVKHHYTSLVEELTEGSDLLVEFCVPNLSLFNKENRAFLHTFKRHIRMSEVYVVIVKHLFTRNYFTTSRNDHGIILAGDRDVIALKEKEKAVLKLLWENPRTPITTMSEKCGLDPKAILRIKKYLEQQKVIRRYTIGIDTELLNLTRSYLLLELDYDDPQAIDKVIEYMKIHPNVIRVTKSIGQYELIALIEKPEGKKIINDLRTHCKIANYKLVYSEKILKHTYVSPGIFE